MADKTAEIGGWHAVEAVLRSQRAVFALYVRAGRADTRRDAVAELARTRGVAIEEISDDELSAMLPDVNHQGCIAQVEPSREWNESDLQDLLEQVAAPLILILDQVQDPHNLGACLRSAAAAGAHAVVVPKDRSAALTPAVRKVAAGTAEIMPLVRVTNLSRCIKTLQQSGLWVVGSAADAPQSIYGIDLKGPIALVLGGEAGGLRRLTTQNCDLLASIPMTDAVESLNVSVAAGVCLFEAVRQRTE